MGSGQSHVPGVFRRAGSLPRGGLARGGCNLPASQVATRRGRPLSGQSASFPSSGPGATGSRRIARRRRVLDLWPRSCHHLLHNNAGGEARWRAIATGSREKPAVRARCAWKTRRLLGIPLPASPRGAPRSRVETVSRFRVQTLIRFIIICKRKCQVIGSLGKRRDGSTLYPTVQLDMGKLGLNTECSMLSFFVSRPAGSLVTAHR
ncbi:hypothetical protein GGR56DRAFT_180281 [Xylariaceae sp. FL0804]|nr:hypothetical protein GGR56DRAFT_180281 [Xylariaceae sp. FL0804]